uniref:Chromodomain helicase DNA binding protein 1-like n=1 Tax=Esox lucius TaxID=8010 RepID=A0A3P9A7U7_ESOLU
FPHPISAVVFSGIQLRAYQLDGVRWLTQCLANQQGCILGDEMGLGKTCQTISLLLYLRGVLGQGGPFLILSPLSVMGNWRSEMERFSPCLKVLCYSGDKDKRAELQRDMDTTHYHVLLTTYEVLVVDEAHRLKNHNSLLHKVLLEFSLGFRLLLTGTPIQNNLLEVYSLLAFIEPGLFPLDQAEEFTSRYSHVQTQPALASELQSVLQPFLLRRVKSEVAADLPKKTELLMYHGLSALQKRYYKAILMKDVDAFKNDQGNKTRLLNILMQLRKCVDHPYLFDGVEPEPFEMGEHLIEASGKLSLLDNMLGFLHQRGHRVLLFSQMTRMLDIVQDYMEYRGYSYERLDGSVRGEERNLAIKNFSSKHVFVFLLSTKAGGVGMNLTAADTVIFMDTDFNPQNDLQAAARCHRIGQTRPVKVIRLLGRDTVEEIVYAQAVSKLRLTNIVIEEGRFSMLDHTHSDSLSDILKFGVDKLLSSDESSVQAVDLSQILGPSEGGEWLTDEDPALIQGLPTEEEEGGVTVSQSEQKSTIKDYIHFICHKIQLNCVSLSGPLGAPLQKRRALSVTELKERSRRNKEAAAKRACLQEDRKKRQEEEKHKKKMAWWESSGYRSLCLPSVESEEEDSDDLSVTSTDSEHTAIGYVLGDVTHPHAKQEDAIIVHCVDDSGRWGTGGLFTALENRSDQPRKQYELAGKMKDLELGSVLMFPVDDKQSRLDGHDQVALIVAHHRGKDNRLSSIHLSALEEGLKKIYRVVKTRKASVHLPRIGHSTRGFNWYGTERLIRKHLASRGIRTLIYYYNRAASALVPHSSDSDSEIGCEEGETTNKSSRSHSPRGPPLPDFMKGVHVFFYNLAASDRKKLARYLIMYDGDEEGLMSPEVTHVVAELETPGADWSVSSGTCCFSNQRQVNTAKFLYQLKS